VKTSPRGTFGKTPSGGGAGSSPPLPALFRIDQAGCQYCLSIEKVDELTLIGVAGSTSVSLGTWDQDRS
jgi:hypothetical protein